MADINYKIAKHEDVTALQEEVTRHKNDYATLEQDYAQHKLDYVQQNDFKLENIVVNGDFRDGLNNWSVGANILDATVSNGILSFTGNSTSSIAYADTISKRSLGLSILANNVYYMRMRAKAEETVSATVYDNRHTAISISTPDFSTDSLIFTANTDTNRLHIGGSLDKKCYVDYIKLINLTHMFYPSVIPYITANAMDKLIEILPDRYFEGEITLSEKQKINWMMILILEGVYAQIALGGSTI